MAVNIHITIIELNALHTKRQNLFQELDAVIHLLMRSEERFSRNAETDLVCRLLLEKKKNYHPTWLTPHDRSRPPIRLPPPPPPRPIREHLLHRGRTPR